MVVAAMLVLLVINSYLVSKYNGPREEQCHSVTL